MVVKHNQILIILDVICRLTLLDDVQCTLYTVQGYPQRMRLQRRFTKGEH